MIIYVVFDLFKIISLESILKTYLEIVVFRLQTNVSDTCIKMIMQLSVNSNLVQR